MDRRLRRAAATLVAGPSCTGGRRTWFGAWAGVVSVASAVLLGAGTSLASGRGLVADALLVFVVGWSAALLFAGALLLLGRAVRGVPAGLRALSVTLLVVLAVPFFFAAGPHALAVSAVLLLAGGLAGAGLASIRSAAVRSRLAVGAVLLGLAALGGTIGWLATGEGRDDGVTPAAAGDLPVASFRYGSGVHRHRVEYGSAVDVRTATVDGTPLLARWTGWRGALRSRYWGFGPDALPRNATVWYPQAEGRFPLVLIVHGNAPMELPSDTGYDWLATDLASRGYVVASVEQSFLNDSRARGGDLGDEVDARAWLLLEHLRLWRGWQAAPEHPAHARVDLDRIALIGHSRGGEAASTAAAFDALGAYPEDATVSFDAGFGIDAVVTLSPSDGHYRPGGRATRLTDVSYLTLQGGLDADHVAFHGLRQYERVALTGAAPGVKAAVHLPTANHGQFNTVWGRQDFSGLAGRVLNTAAIMPPASQRAAARAAIVGFLDATLRGDDAALAPLLDPAHPGWPDGADVAVRFADHSEVTLADFSEDADPSTGTLTGARISATGLTGWREAPVPPRWDEQHSNAALLEWAGPGGAYTVRLPAGWQPPADAVLALTVAAVSDARPELAANAPLDFTIEVVDAAGRIVATSLTDLGGWSPARPARRLKPPLPDPGGSVEPVGRTFRVALASAEQPFDPTDLREIRLVFDRTPAGAVYVERVALGRGPGG